MAAETQAETLAQILRVSKENHGMILQLGEHIDLLTSIVAGLAAVDPWVSDDAGTTWCALCEVQTVSWAEDAGDPIPEHAEDCAWRMARQVMGLKWEGWHPDE